MIRLICINLPDIFQVKVLGSIVLSSTILDALYVLKFPLVIGSDYAAGYVASATMPFKYAQTDPRWNFDVWHLANPFRHSLPVSLIRSSPTASIA